MPYHKLEKVLKLLQIKREKEKRIMKGKKKKKNKYLRPALIRSSSVFLSLGFCTKCRQVRGRH